ncbi:MAG: hypothetical protein HKN14_05000 [Marinicaulis sp.]|nr:hypothetical protein [Marinicaulis sp.]NNE40260.1 hypothetical protein [Marinicaulis sp.]
MTAGAGLLAPTISYAADYSGLEYSSYEFPPPKNTGKVWKVYKAAWDASDEEGYGHFVQAIGRSNCTTLAACLNNPANPYRSDDDPELNGDCADMAYILRAYYAWKNGLPFSFQNAMRTADRSGEDLRYSSNGNIVAGRRAIRNITSNAHTFLRSIGGQVSTAMFRTHPETGAGSGHDDFYPVKITRDAVRPGVIAYDIFGHVGIVYEILEDGRVLVIAAHPDQSVTRSTYGPNFMRSKPALGAGLKAWRPIRVEGARVNDDGSITGGRLAAAKNEELSDYSLEQYVGTHPDPGGVWHYGEFRHQDRSLKYYDFVRRRLASPSFRYNPIDELRFGLETICGSLRARKYAVDSAVTIGLHLKPHPKKLPPNIYGTYGEWEEYSTPSRDARLKVSFIELRRDMQYLVEAVEADDPSVDYDGTDLSGDLIAAFNEENDACTFTYWRSDKSRVRLNISHSIARLFDFSFNPYLCPERRWGATGYELETCTDDEVKGQWYNALRFLRYQAERTYDVRMDFGLEQLKPPMVAAAEEGGLGVEAPADADLRRYLYSLQDVVVAAGDPGPIKMTPVSNEGEDEFLLPEWHYRLNEERLKKIENLGR